MKRVRYAIALAFVWLAFSLLSSQATAATVQAVEEGIKVDAGSFGAFVISYPELIGANQKPAQVLIEKKPAGKSATVKYADGAVVEISIDDAGDIIYRLRGRDDKVKQFKTMAILPYATLNGGSFSINGGPAQPFPLDKPAKPHLFQGNKQMLELTAQDGTTLTLGAPREYSYLQLTDNREWGWQAYAWMTLTPIDRGNPVFVITTSGRKPEQVAAAAVRGGPAPAVPAKPAAKPVVLVDKFGQTTRFDYPDKVKSEEELKADVEKEKAYYDSLQPPTFDRFGGLPGSGEALGLTKTGFFHVERKNDRWYLVNPEGNAYFALGVCVYSPVDDYTFIAGREGIYEWLPDRNGEFKTAFREADASALSFHLVNQIRKYGEPFDLTRYQARMLDRLRKWGFNTVGPFSSPTSAVHERNFAYVVTLPYGKWPGIPTIPGVIGTWDVFDPKNVERLEAAFAEGLPKRKDDPNLIGYYLNNEPIYEDLVRVVPRLPGSKHPAKRRLVQMLQEKYQTIDAFNTAWKMQAGSFDDLIEPGLPVSTAEAAADMAAYHDLFFETYYKLIYDTFKKHDPNHMLLGNRFQSGTINNRRLVEIGAKYLDIISYNYYTYGIDLDRLKRIHQWSGGKPMMLTEWFYDSPKDSGLPGGGKDVSSQAERGLAYRNYVEQAASLDFIVGQTWFTLVDQSLTGRWFQKYNGENANSGLIAVTDRPWKDMLVHVMETNYTIYDLITGKRKPFAWDDPRFVMSQAAKKSLTIPRATGPVAMDGTANGFPGVPAEPISGQRLVTGANADGFEASFKLCYDDDNLYVLVDVSDPTPMRNEMSADKLWSADAVELFIGHEKLDEPGQPLFSDRQILLGAGKEPKAYVTKQTEQPPIQVVVVPRVDGKGYVLQAKIPSEALGFKPAEGKEIRFDLAVDDAADGKRRDRQLMWNGTDRNSGDRTGWGRATFVK